MLGIFYILLFWAIGNGISILMDGYLPGSIVGMILLFAALCLRLVKAGHIRPAARFLLGSMALFFIPYGVGLVESYPLILDRFWAIVLSAGASTVLVLLCTGHIFQKLNRRSK
ncbi:MAG: CidA/LrgA family protein [Alistipes sp.]|nr:CidA/LrgA family protein [Alistipes sp.]